MTSRHTFFRYLYIVLISTALISEIACAQTKPKGKTNKPVRTLKGTGVSDFDAIYNYMECIECNAEDSTGIIKLKGNRISFLSEIVRYGAPADKQKSYMATLQQDYKKMEDYLARRGKKAAMGISEFEKYYMEKYNLLYQTRAVSALSLLKGGMAELMVLRKDLCPADTANVVCLAITYNLKDAQNQKKN
ncbi:hypothetical protein DYBT9275_02480 [Dyadobacter sp. CECT 9275]|uniref:Uncharacterized protein n=1 Tax=Dyadobacter helix TaxID=2822344 RepID=A0A916NBV6_9BACT|nr:hypothetical protein [Dyadobacter sp. CECT 9275]CAG5000521.1 hypothetical protein DYBT9275_02480 [Dyadobacter sp. CECT 9275]